MTQERAQSIIRKEYGENATAIGHGTTENCAVAIVWIYLDETEDDYKIHMTAEN